MSHLNPAAVQLGTPRRHELLAVGGAVAVAGIVVAAMAVSNLLSPNRVTEPTVPAAAEAAVATVGASPTAATPSPTPDAATALAAIAGRWKGTLVRPPSGASSGVTIDTILEVSPTCAQSRRACGSFSESAGGRWSCVFEPWFLGADRGSITLSFEMVPVDEYWQSCSAERVLVTPLDGGRGVVVEEVGDGVLDTPGRGVLTPSVIP
jgi:hypothetical protein